jgi:hypothetical protein
MDLYESENDREICADLTLKGFTALGTKSFIFRPETKSPFYVPTFPQRRILQ